MSHVKASPSSASYETTGSDSLCDGEDNAFESLSLSFGIVTAFSLLK